MLFMVIERFAPGALTRVGERFKAKGRMLPEGVVYHASWMARDGSRCFQLMEAPARAALDPWLRAWQDLTEFEIVVVETSADFWRQL